LLRILFIIYFILFFNKVAHFDGVLTKLTRVTNCRRLLYIILISLRSSCETGHFAKSASMWSSLWQKWKV